MVRSVREVNLGYLSRWRDLAKRVQVSDAGAEIGPGNPTILMTRRAAPNPPALIESQGGGGGAQASVGTVSAQASTVVRMASS